MTLPVLTESGQAQLDQIPEFLHGDPTLRAVQRVTASEFDDIREALAALRNDLIPAMSTDPKLWEAVLGLTPGGLAGESSAFRRGKVLNALARALSEGSGTEWIQSLTNIFGGTWSYQETDNGDRFVYDAFDNASIANWTPLLIGSTDGSGDHFNIKNGGYIDAVHASTTGWRDQTLRALYYTGNTGTRYAGFVAKHLDANNRLRPRFSASGNVLGLYKYDGGAESLIGSTQAYTFANDTLYGIETVIAGNVVTMNLYDNGFSNVLATKANTLAGGDATKFGSGVAGKSGLHGLASSPSGVYLDQFQGVGDVAPAVSVPDYTVRVTLPYGSGTPQAVLAETVLRQITPAHIDIVVVYADNFILGQDLLGQDTL